MPNHRYLYHYESTVNRGCDRLQNLSIRPIFLRNFGAKRLRFFLRCMSTTRKARGDRVLFTSAFSYFLSLMNGDTAEFGFADDLSVSLKYSTRYIHVESLLQGIIHHMTKRVPNEMGGGVSTLS